MDSAIGERDGIAGVDEINDIANAGRTERHIWRPHVKDSIAGGSENERHIWRRHCLW